MTTYRFVTRMMKRLMWSVFLLCLGFTLGVTAGNDIVQGLFRIVTSQPAPTPQSDDGFSFPWSHNGR